LSRHGFALLVAMLAGCASLPESPSSTGRTCFELEGRIAIDREGRGVLANMHWVQRPDRGVIELGSALGPTLARLQERPDEAQLTTPERVWQAESGRTLMRQLLGVDLPLAALADWVVGQLPPNAEIERDAVGRPASAHFQGYSVRYADHTSDEPDGRPTRIDIRRHALHMRLKIDHWESCP
jgi:outer membrane lipoprotein LolB